jgi:FMN-dependent NADH-azoreductase
MKLLHIDSSVLGPHSVSRQVSAAIVDRLRQETPGLDITYRDLTSMPLAHLSGSHLAAAQGALPEAALAPDLAAGQAVMDEFLAADVVVLGVPMYNFTIPSQLKAWIDRILVSGKTFKYGAQGVEGLAGNKRVIIAISRGGFYGARARPAAASAMNAAASSGPPSPGGSSVCEPEPLPEDTRVRRPPVLVNKNIQCRVLLQGTLFESATLGRISQLFRW